MGARTQCDNKRIAECEGGPMSLRAMKAAMKTSQGSPALRMQEAESNAKSTIDRPQKNFSERVSGNFSKEVFEDVPPTNSQQKSNCTKCNGSVFWSPKGNDSLIRCMACQPPPSEMMIGRTYVFDDVGNHRPEFEFEIGFGKPVCDQCHSMLVRMSHLGYHCAVCRSSIHKSIEEMWW